MTDPSVAFDGQGNVYVLTLQTSGAADGALVLTSSISPAPRRRSLPTRSSTSGSPAPTGSPPRSCPSMRRRPIRPRGCPGPPCEQRLHRLGQHRHRARQYHPLYRVGFNPNRAELVVGTPISSPSGNEESLAFSAATVVDIPPPARSAGLGGNFGPQQDTHPQLVINQNAAGQVTVAWDDFGTGATASPPFDILNSNLVQAGDTYGFSGATGPITRHRHHGPARP